MSAGTTANFVVSYDAALAQDGATIASALLVTCESDFGALRALFGGAPAGLPCRINITPEADGAGHPTCSSVEISVGARTALGLNLPFLRWLMVAELVEAFAASFAPAWNCKYSHGEGLSRVLASEICPGAILPTWVSAPVWLDSQRPNWVDQTDETDASYESLGCAVLFLNWLRFQLGLGWNQIISAGASTLGQTYTILTGEPDGFAKFLTLLASRFPLGQPSGVMSDNVFPI